MLIGLRPATALFLSLSIAGSPAAAEDAAAANRLFMGAVHAKTAEERLSEPDADSIIRRDELLGTVLSVLNRIVTDHPGSDLAVRLMIGDRIGPLSTPIAELILSEMQERRASVECLSAPNRRCVLAEALAQTFNSTQPQFWPSEDPKPGRLRQMLGY
jgi:hypothetical protein